MAQRAGKRGVRPPDTIRPFLPSPGTLGPRARPALARRPGQEHAGSALGSQPLVWREPSRQVALKALRKERLDALETHVRFMTESVQQSQLDIAAGVVALLVLQAQVDEKVSAADVDPVMKDLNEQIGVAREQYNSASAAATESWAKLQGGVQDALGTLRESADSARARIEQG